MQEYSGFKKLMVIEIAGHPYLIGKRMNSLVSYSMKQPNLKAFFSDRRQFVLIYFTHVL